MARTSTPSQATPELTPARAAAAPEPALNTDAPVHEEIASLDVAKLTGRSEETAPAVEESEQRGEYRGQAVDGGLVAYGPNTYSLVDAVRLGLVPPQTVEPRL